MSGYPPRLAVATKPGKRLVRVLLYDLLGGGGNGLPRGATAMCTGQMQIADSLSIKVSHSTAMISGHLCLRQGSVAVDINDQRLASYYARKLSYQSDCWAAGDGVGRRTRLALQQPSVLSAGPGDRLVHSAVFAAG